MKEERYFYAPDAPKACELPEEEAQHAIRVLRLKEGAEIFLMDGRGTYYRAEITLCTNHQCQYRILETLPQSKPWRGHLTIAVAPTKMMERVEWFVEKATEIGIDEIVFLDCRFSERRQVKIPRLEKICISAVKQSHKAWVPVIRGMVSIDDFIRECTKGVRCIAHCYNEERHDLFSLLKDNRAADEDITIMIGPEGDFSIDEVQKAIEQGWVPVSLGASRLRTETAAMVATEMMQLNN
ncbi:MAG: 16S rRNA (uracil(1498)-N(3))-methyltransferase [Prevotella sp.]|nr:16S rRNA (uracil(1498)-N(3))-methyltransferase [Prevotella sp.]